MTANRLTDHPDRRGPGARAIGVFGALTHLVVARLRARRSAALLIGSSIAGTIVVIGSLLGVGVVTEDVATRRALADLAPSDRLIGIRETAENAGGEISLGQARAVFSEVDADRFARKALEPVLDLTKPIVSVTLYLPSPEPFRVMALNDAPRWTALVDGRMPKPCLGGIRCEAVRVGSFSLPTGVGDIGTTVKMQEMRLDIVGVVTPSADLPVSVIQPDGLGLLVDGLEGLRDTTATASIHRTTFWLAPIDPERVHSWTLDDLRIRADAVERSLSEAYRQFRFDSPAQPLEALQARMAVAGGRLIFVSSLIVGVLLAFAAFAAAVERTDVLVEDRRLQASGASSLGRLGFVVMEAVLPAALGAIAGVALAVAVVASFAAVQQVPIDAVIERALLRPEPARIIGLLAVLGVVAVGIGIHPSAGRLLEPRLMISAAVPLVAVLLWDRLNTGAVDPQQLAAEATSPNAVLLPGALGLAVVLASLIGVPPVLRWLARHVQAAPLSVRLAVVSVAREPLRPAAVMTLLAFSVGAVVFGQVYAATLRQGASDQAAFRTGLDVRIQMLASNAELSNEVIQFLQEGAAGAGVVAHPMVRGQGQTATGRKFEAAGVQADLVPALDGWRSDFSSSRPEELAAAISMPGDWTMPSQDIPDGTRQISITLDATGDPVSLSLVVQEAMGSVRYIPLGDVAKGPQVLRAELFDRHEREIAKPAEPRGWRILGLLAANGGDAGPGRPSEGSLQHAELHVAGLDSLIAPSTALQIDVSGSRSRVFIRPPAPTDGLVLPAIVSPDLAQDVDPEGVLAVTIGPNLRMQLKPVGTTARFPTMLGASSLVIVDLAPLLLAMNVNDPGSGIPNQILLDTPSDAQANAAVQALGRDPFPVGSLVVQSRPAIETRLASDPFAIGIVWGLALGAIAGLLLSIAAVVMATDADLRDERGELWDLEALGAKPSSLVWLVVLRTIGLCALGTGVGIGIGTGLGWFAATSIAVGGEGGTPEPQLMLVFPWFLVALMSIGLLTLLSFAVLMLARRHFRRPSLGEASR